MIDKEIAKEYVDTLLNKDDPELDKFLDENLGDLELNKKQAGTLLGIIKGVGICSYLAGLKAGRPEWHDLRKDPNDLPERMGLGSIEVYIAYEDGVTDFACYRFDKNGWERSENEELVGNVIAWCEILTFTDKE